MEFTDSSNWMKLQILLDRGSACLKEIFYAKWKAKTGREWDNGSADIILNHQFKHLTNAQKHIISKGDVREWDVNTLRAILCSKELFKDIPDDQKKWINLIARIRNKINHLPNKTMTHQQFYEWWTTLQQILIAFGVSETDLEQLKKESSSNKVELKMKEMLTDKSNTKEAARLKEEGNDAFKIGDYAKAIKLFTTGIELLGIAAKDRAVLISNRCIAYVKRFQYETNDDFLSAAKTDAKIVIELRPDWWRGYFRMGQVHIALRDYRKAEKSLNIAAAKDPQNQQIIDLRSHARLLQGQEERMDFLDPTSMFLKTEDIIRTRTEHSGIYHDLQEHKKNEDRNFKSGIPALENLEFCRRGHRCRYGTDGFPRDLELAASYYRKAAERGNAEGMFNLGMVMLQGEGVKQDFAGALNWLKTAAAQPRFDPFITGYDHPNIGVAEAHHALGLCYSEGVGVEKNMLKACEWYEKAVELGCQTSANNLGVIYRNGIRGCMMPDLVKAEQYCRLAASHHSSPDPNAMQNLAELYFNNGDLERALRWGRRAMQYGNRKPTLHCLTSEMECEIKKFEQSGIAAWEAENGLCSDGLTIIQRKNRYLSDISKYYAKMKKQMDIVVYELKGPLCEGIYSKVVEPSEFQHCALYSVYGKKLWIAKQHCLVAMRVLTSELSANDKLPSLIIFEKFVMEFSSGVRIDYNVYQWPQTLWDKTISIINFLLRHKVPFDEHVRVCYVALHSLHSAEECIAFLDECIRLYPLNVYFLETRASLKMCQLKCCEEGICDIRKALKLDPSKSDLLYDLATMMRLAGSFKAKDITDVYQQFLRMAPRDHCKVPASYYAIALVNMRQLEPRTNNNKLEWEQLVEGKKFYEFGVAAEKDQLSFFVPYKSTTKADVEHYLLRIAKLSQLPISLSAENLPATEDSNPIMDSKLTDPNRTLKIKQHRKSVKRFSGWSVLNPSTIKPPRNQQLPQSLTGLRPISMEEMEPTKDHIYGGFILSVTVIDELYSTGSSLCVLIKDVNSWFERCYIHHTW